MKGRLSTLFVVTMIVAMMCAALPVLTASRDSARYGDVGYPDEPRSRAFGLFSLPR